MVASSFQAQGAERWHRNNFPASQPLLSGQCHGSAGSAGSPVASVLISVFILAHRVSLDRSLPFRSLFCVALSLYEVVQPNWPFPQRGLADNVEGQMKIAPCCSFCCAWHRTAFLMNAVINAYRNVKISARTVQKFTGVFCQVVKGPHIKKIATWVDVCSVRLPKGPSQFIWFIELPVQWAELEGIKKKRPLTGTAWVASPTKYHHATPFLVSCWLLAVAMTLHTQMWGFGANWSLQLQPCFRWDCSHKWCWDAHPSGICCWEWPLCAKSQEVSS